MTEILRCPLAPAVEPTLETTDNGWFVSVREVDTGFFVDGPEEATQDEAIAAWNVVMRGLQTTESAKDRLREVARKLEERGVTDIKPFLADYKDKPASLVMHQVADALEAFLEGDFVPAPKLGDSTVSSDRTTALVAAGDKLDAVISAAQQVLTDYLTPQGPAADRTISRLLGLFDGRWQRTAQGAWRAAKEDTK